MYNEGVCSVGGSERREKGWVEGGGKERGMNSQWYYTYLRFVCSSRKNPFALLVALDDNQSGEGWLFWDDGESLATYETGSYSLLHFTARKVNIRQMRKCLFSYCSA